MFVCCQNQNNDKRCYGSVNNTNQIYYEIFLKNVESLKNFCGGKICIVQTQQAWDICFKKNNKNANNYKGNNGVGSNYATDH